MKFSHYLKTLIDEGHRWQYTDLAGVETPPRNFLLKIQWYLLVIALLSCLYLPSGFSKEFTGYIVTALSIFIGLFLTIMLSIFDKFKSLKPEIENNDPKIDSVNRDIALIKMKNFFKQFTSLTSYAILISIFSIILLSVNWFGTFFNDSVCNYPIVQIYPAGISVSRFFRLLLVSSYNAVAMYFLLDLLLIIVFSLSSLHQYMIGEFNQIKIKKDA
jgi:hypothetical protein